MSLGPVAKDHIRTIIEGWDEVFGLRNSTAAAPRFFNNLGLGHIKRKTTKTKKKIHNEKKIMNLLVVKL